MRYGGASNKNLLNIIRQNFIILTILGIEKNFMKIIKFLYFKLKERLKQFFIKPKSFLNKLNKYLILKLILIKKINKIKKISR